MSLCLTKHHAKKTYWGKWGMAPRIFDFSTRWRRVVSFTPRPLYPQGKSPWYPLDRRLRGPQSRSGRGGEEKNFQSPPGIEPYNLDRPDRSPALYRLSYHGSGRSVSELLNKPSFDLVFLARMALDRWACSQIFNYGNMASNYAFLSTCHLHL
jgi:hypothetical protein